MKSSLLLVFQDPVAKFLVSDWGAIVDSVIGLSYRPASLCSLAGRYDNPIYAGVDLSLQSGTMNLATDSLLSTEGGNVWQLLFLTSLSKGSGFNEV